MIHIHKQPAGHLQMLKKAMVRALQSAHPQNLAVSLGGGRQVGRKVHLDGFDIGFCGFNLFVQQHYGLIRHALSVVEVSA